MSMLDVLSHDGSLREQAQSYLKAQSWAQAHECLAVLVAIDPRDAWALQWRVVVALALGQPQQALDAAQAALQALPSAAAQARAEVLYNQGQAHGLLGQAGQALAAFEQSLAAQPDQALVSLVELGRAKALAQLGQHDQAGRAVTLALQADPNDLEALALLANSLVKAGEPARALQAFAQHERAKPAAPFMACMVVFLHRQLADWGWPGLPINADEGVHLQQMLTQGQPPELALLAHRAWQGMPAIEPFAGLVLYDDPALQRHVAEGFLRHLHPPVAPPEPPAAALLAGAPVRGPGAPLKVAYVSSDFYAHATSFLLAGVLARHNPARVQVLLLSYSPPTKDGPDAMRQRLQALGHTWVDVNTWPDAQVAQWCRAEGVDVAVDLKGLTRDSRPGIFAHRAAPVQVNWLGYPGTLPAAYYDWVLADAQVLPPALEPHFAEAVWRLPHSYQPTDNTRARVAPVPGARLAHGLPEQAVVLCSFNNSFKFTPATWALWMRLLQAVPGSVLWLLQGHARTQTNLRAAATAAGVDATRLVFAPTLPQPEHLARVALADLSLEAWPYNAHTTASDALWAGVPHLTCAGQSFASRVGASLVTALGMADELLATDLADYEARVLHLMRHPQALAALRQKVQAQGATAPLFDTARFTRDLEDALHGMRQASRA
jgi:protein O-GlcNAc transferase